MSKKNETKKRKSNYNANRACYRSSDGMYYCYKYWDADAKRMVTQQLEVGNDISEEWTIFLDETDHEQDLNDRYQSELRDPLFEKKLGDYKADPEGEDAVDPWEKLSRKSDSPEEALFSEPKPENPQETQVRKVIEESCTKSQQDFYFDHFGMSIQLEEMRQKEAAETGKLPTAAAMTNRKNKIIEKAAKSLGVERVKRHKYPNKD